MTPTELPRRDEPVVRLPEAALLVPAAVEDYLGHRALVDRPRRPGGEGVEQHV